MATRKAGDFTRTIFQCDKTLERSSSKKHNVCIVYENGNQKMEIAVLNGAKSPDDLEMTNFSFAMDKQHKRDDKPASDMTENDAASKGEVHHISKEDQELKTAQIMSVFKDRIVLYATTENMTAVELYQEINALDVVSIIE